MRTLLLVLTLLLASCQSSYSGITTVVNQCCAAADGRSFHLSGEQLPAFLRDLLSNNVTTALINKGYYPVSADPDLLVVVGYQQQNLPTLSRFDAAGETVSELGDFRFIAAINVRITSAEGITVFDGTINRTHEVSANEYMHTGRASLAFYQAFTELFKPLPAR